MIFKCNINVKAMTSGEHQKSFASDLLVSIKQLMMATSIHVLLMLSRFSLRYKRISVSWSLLKFKILRTTQLTVFKRVIISCKSVLKNILRFVFTKVT